MFGKCEKCDGPLLGHIEVKSRDKNGVRYVTKAVKSFEHWIRRIPGLRGAMMANQKKEDMRSAKIGEYVEIALESVKKKNRQRLKQLS